LVVTFTSSRKGRGRSNWRPLFRSMWPIKNIGSSVAIADKPDVASTARFDRERPEADIGGYFAAMQNTALNSATW
jgi:hypothetical protein